jgi:hypothetical protein
MTNAELVKEINKLKTKLHQKDLEIAELIHMNREVDKMMDVVFKGVLYDQVDQKWWNKLFG